jgi:transposase-like protein
MEWTWFDGHDLSLRKRFLVITQSWLDAWEHVIPFLAFPKELRRVI